MLTFGLIGPAGNKGPNAVLTGTSASVSYNGSPQSFKTAVGDFSFACTYETEVSGSQATFRAEVLTERPEPVHLFLSGRRRGEFCQSQR